jgi:Uma2 family endonuclease
MTAVFADELPKIVEQRLTTTYLHSLPEDGLRRELIDGSVIVSPSATARHNILALWIAQILDEANPGVDHVVSVDQSMTIDDYNEPRPDIVVIRADYLDQTPFPVTGTLLAAEIVSPTSVERDHETKRRVYAQAGIPAYWIIVTDVRAGTIALTELALDEQAGGYREKTPATTGVFQTDWPWPVKIDLPALAERMARYRRKSNQG